MTTLQPTSAWEWPAIEDFLRSERIPIRLGCLTRSGKPMVCSLWYLYDEGALWCATQKNARLARHLARCADCGFEIAPDRMPYRGVRGQGRAELLPQCGREILLQLIDRYLETRESAFARWLIARADREVAIRIHPEWLTSWDFGARMRGASH